MKRRRLRKIRKLPEWCLNKDYAFDRHETDPYSVNTDRSQPQPAEDKDPRTAFDSLNPEKPRGM